MKTNEAGLEIIKRFEGLGDGDADAPGLQPYLDPIGIPTIGWGSIWGSDGRRVTMEHPAIDEAEADRLMQRELGHTERAVGALVKVALTPDQFSALCSFTYNVGSGNLKASTLRAKINRGDFAGAMAEFPKWKFAGGRVLSGLVRRRKAEADLFSGIT